MELDNEIAGLKRRRTELADAVEECERRLTSLERARAMSRTLGGPKRLAGAGYLLA